jgi:hypothetical protein
MGAAFAVPAVAVSAVPVAAPAVAPVVAPVAVLAPAPVPAPAPVAPPPRLATPAEVLSELHQQRDGSRRVVATVRPGFAQRTPALRATPEFAAATAGIMRSLAQAMVPAGGAP